MKLNRIIFYFTLFSLLFSCADYKTSKSTQEKNKVYLSSFGFALIYEDHHYINKTVHKKINNEKIEVMHRLLKKNTTIKIINPINGKVVETKVFKRGVYPKIFNLVISEKVASILELDINNPYIEVLEVKKNKTFVAKKSNMFEEEKNVTEKAPVVEIKINDLTKSVQKIEKKINKSNSFVLVISDFYFVDSANNLKKELIKKTGINQFKIKKIEQNKYRLSIGPFKNFNALKLTYISLNNLGFNDLNIYNEN